jgi:hypothetical protein
MPVDMKEVRAALEPEELDYPEAARQLGAEALPHLEKIIGGTDVSLAAKATYLAGLIGGEQSVAAVAKAARSSEVPVRIAAAAAATHLPAEHSENVLLQLVDDADVGVQKIAVRSAPASMSSALQSRVSAIRENLRVVAAAKPKAGKAAKAPKKATKKATKKVAKKAVKKAVKRASASKKK